MAYQTREISIEDGRPRELYRFSVDANIWSYTSAAEKITYQSVDYQPLEISRSEPEQSREKGRSGIDITLPRDTPVARLFIGIVPSKPVNVTIFRLHEDDSEVIDFWKGRVRAMERGGKLDAVLKCETNLASLQRLGLQQKFQSNCNVALFSVRCGVPRSPFQIDAPVQFISADKLQIRATAWINADLTYYPGGFVQRANGDARTITGQLADGTLTLMQPFENLIVGETVSALAACNHTFAHCQGRFGAHTNNGESYAGFPTVPNQNPYETGVK